MIRCEKISAFYFSPNGTTRCAAQAVASGIGAPVKDYDLTRFENRWKRVELTENEVVILALPTYGGRLPGICREFFRVIRAKGNYAVVMTTYGNHDYGEALAELKNRAAEIGLTVIAGAAVPAQHCVKAEIAEGRPDKQDLQALCSFGDRIRRLLEHEEQPKEIMLQGAYPYRYKLHDIRVAPVTGENCVRCGKCAENCPVKAINPLNLLETDVIRCLLCMRCVHQCPMGARALLDETVLEKMRLRNRMCSAPRQQEYFVGTT